MNPTENIVPDMTSNEALRRLLFYFVDENGIPRTSPANQIMLIPAYCRVYNSGPINVPNEQLYALPFDSEQFDSDSMHNTTYSTRITINRAGWYVITANIVFYSSLGRHLCSIYLNGEAELVRQEMSPATIEPATQPGVSLATQWYMQPGDFIELNVYQSSGDDVQVLAPTHFAAARISA